MQLVLNRQSVFLLLLMLILLVVAVIGTYVYRDSIEKRERDALDKHLATNESTPPTFLDRQGNKFSFPRTRSDITIVTLWASWSPFSAADFAILRTQLERYNDSQLSVILLNRKESLTSAERYLTEFSPPERAIVIIDEEDRYYQNVAGYTMPETMVYNRNGEVVLHVRGPLDSAVLGTVLEESL